MRYKIIFTDRAVKDIHKIDESTKERIGKKLMDYSLNPLSHSKKLSDPVIGQYRFRVGDYRIIFDIDDDVIVVLRIGHRKKIYKK